MLGQAEQSLGVVFTHTEEDQLKESHTAASMKKREKRKEKNAQSEGRSKTDGLGSMSSLLICQLSVM